MSTPAFELDQEQIRDLVLRSDSERDRTRSRPTSIDSMRFGGGAPIVAEWRCRYPGPKSSAPPCRVMIPVSSETVEQLEMFNRQLAARGEEPIGTHEVMVCDAHQRLLQDHQRNAMPAKRTQHAVEMRDAIRNLKESADPRREHGLLDIIAKLHHPDIEGLITSLEEKLQGGQRRRKL